jgi:hypothetical protein
VKMAIFAKNEEQCFNWTITSNQNMHCNIGRFVKMPLSNLVGKHSNALGSL